MIFARIGDGPCNCYYYKFVRLWIKSAFNMYNNDRDWNFYIVFIEQIIIQKQTFVKY